MPNRTRLKNYYIYVYLDPEKPGKYIYGEYSFDFEPFYVGKGKGNRIFHFRQPSGPFLKKKMNKVLSPIYLMVQRSLREQEAFLEEIKMIAIIGRRDQGKGPLCNLTDGGDGVSGRICSEATKQKQKETETWEVRSIASKKAWETRRKNGNAHCSKEQKQKLREANLGKKPSEETKEKLRIIGKLKRGHLHSEETKEKLRQINLGKKKGPPSEETKQKIRKALKGRKNGPLSKETKQKIRNNHKGMLGKHHSEETRKKLREKNIGKRLTEETKSKMVHIGMKGKRHSEETKKKMSVAKKRIMLNYVR